MSNMEVSSVDSVDIDTLLLQQFSCMGTQDKEVLIKQFQALFGASEPARDVCVFYLEMNNWNLQAAVSTYFEYNQEPFLLQGPLSIAYNASFVSFLADPNRDDNDVYLAKPDSKISYSWEIKNTGSNQWPTGLTARYTDGHRLSLLDRVSIDNIVPSCTTIATIELTAPSQPGFYQAIWRLSSFTGQLFGDPLYIFLKVLTPLELEERQLDITLQASHINKDAINDDDDGMVVNVDNNNFTDFFADNNKTFNFNNITSNNNNFSSTTTTITYNNNLNTRTSSSDNINNNDNTNKNNLLLNNNKNNTLDSDIMET